MKLPPIGPGPGTPFAFSIILAGSARCWLVLAARPTGFSWRCPPLGASRAADATPTPTSAKCKPTKDAPCRADNNNNRCNGTGAAHFDGQRRPFHFYFFSSSFALRLRSPSLRFAIHAAAPCVPCFCVTGSSCAPQSVQLLTPFVCSGGHYATRVLGRYRTRNPLAQRSGTLWKACCIDAFLRQIGR